MEIKCKFCPKVFTGKHRFQSLRKHVTNENGLSKGCTYLISQNINLTKEEATQLKNNIRKGKNIYVGKLTVLQPAHNIVLEDDAPENLNNQQDLDQNNNEQNAEIVENNEQNTGFDVDGIVAEACETVTDLLADKCDEILTNIEEKFEATFDEFDKKRDDMINKSAKTVKSLEQKLRKQIETLNATIEAQDKTLGEQSERFETILNAQKQEYNDIAACQVKFKWLVVKLVSSSSNDGVAHPIGGCQLCSRHKDILLRQCKGARVTNRSGWMSCNVVLDPQHRMTTLRDHENSDTHVTAVDCEKSRVQNPLGMMIAKHSELEKKQTDRLFISVYSSICRHHSFKDHPREMHTLHTMGYHVPNRHGHEKAPPIVTDILFDEITSQVAEYINRDNPATNRKLKMSGQFDKCTKDNHRQVFEVTFFGY